jgi:phosphoglycerate dehydrogenase-like enzyme
MVETAPRLAFLSRMAYGDTTPDAAVPAIRTLVDLHRLGRVEIGPNILPDLLPEIPLELEHSCRALVCRPTWGGSVTEELVERLRIPDEPFFVATLSSGKSHIAVDGAGVEVLNAQSGNADQTAELTVFLAICLLRRALMPMVNMGFGVYLRPDFTRTRSLHGVTWVVIGPGTVGSAVLKKASAMGAGYLRAFHPKFAGQTESEIAAAYPALAELGVDLTGDVDRALKDADVVSVHIPSNEDTAGMINGSWFDRLPDSAVLVNCSRHEVIDETALLTNLEANRLRGYASDVLPSQAERRAANPHLPDVELWRRACWSMITSIERCTHRPCAFQDVSLAENFMIAEPSSERNMVYTPHIGGSTLDAETAVAQEVVDQLLTELAVAP